MKLQTFDPRHHRFNPPSSFNRQEKQKSNLNLFSEIKKF